MTPHTNNSEFDSKLVDLVRANPMLYEKELRVNPYENMKKKTELWKSIAASLEVETKYCIVRWKSLRDKFRRELAKSREMAQSLDLDANKAASTSTWYLLEKMSFLEGHIKYFVQHHAKSQQSHQVAISWNEMDAEQLIEEVADDDPLQEAMDEQNTSISKEVDATNIATAPVVNMKRIEALLEGLDEPNRLRAEKRIVAYLCRCQLKSLNGENVDDVFI